MPRIKRSGLPRALFDHILLRIQQRGITPEDLGRMAAWMDGQPVVPVGAWFKRFETFILCGEGELVKTVLTSKQSAIGEEVK
ncbi:MAG TPA: hypothetical protein PLF88_02930 [Opitutaceae bacterium]|nr:hypothetical protein [Opitutaceae bacterium]HRJ47129.1 hypothetical protein [Opitutaceae bacterium]